MKRISDGKFFKILQNSSCIDGNKELYSLLFGKQDMTGSESRKLFLAATRLFYNNYKNIQPQQMILGDLHVWLLISYSVTRSLKGYEAFVRPVLLVGPVLAVASGGRGHAGLAAWQR